MTSEIGLLKLISWGRSALPLKAAGCMRFISKHQHFPRFWLLIILLLFVCQNMLHISILPRSLLKGTNRQHSDQMSQIIQK